MNDKSRLDKLAVMIYYLPPLLLESHQSHVTLLSLLDLLA